MSTEAGGSQRLVLRNTLMLVGAQFAGAPLSIFVNILIGRYLGPEAFGQNFLAWTFTLFGFLVVEWGHGNVITAAVSLDRARGGEYLGTTVGWRLSASVIVYGVLAGACWLLDFSSDFQLVLALVTLQCVLGTTTNACQDVVRGFERTDVAALGQLGNQAVTALVVIPVLMLGGKLHAVLIAQAVAQAVVLVVVWRAARRIGKTPLVFRRDTVTRLFRQGTPFLAYGVAMAAQGIIDAAFLAKLVPGEVVGWQAAARRLTGVLVIPATALVGALYPTLARLHATDLDGYRNTLRGALKGTMMLAVPVALCCALYRDVGIELYRKGAYGPARDNLLVNSVLLFLIYLTMPLGSAILAAGRQRVWAIVQLLCVATSSALDPFLIPWFQRHYGNGGLGVNVAGVVSEVWMISAALVLIPKGSLNREVGLGLLRPVAAGLVMLAAGLAMVRITPFVAAPVSFATYLATLWAIGGIDPAHIAAARHAVLRKMKRAA